MTSHESEHGTVTVIFRKEESLLVPELSLPIEQRNPRETYEHAMYRLSQRNGVIGHIEHVIPTDGLEGVSDYVYLGRAIGDELEGNELLVHISEVPTYIEQHTQLNDTEKELFRRALLLLNTSTPVQLDK